ncbi:hypothetical protein AAFC00_002165 [Neodothiora populina]|uniref:Acetyl-CoA synthetase-like protein n=1 Tax=Neodothiora populina TaxID=2781224 RepID=A0ABR3PGJ4_9PEZI
MLLRTSASCTSALASRAGHVHLYRPALPFYIRSTIAARRAISRRTIATLPSTPLFEAISSHDPQSTAVVHSLSGRSFTYASLLQDVAARKDELARQATAVGSAIQGQRVAFLIENSYDYVVTLLSVLGSSAIAVPLSPNFPAGELKYILEQSEALMLLSSTKFAAKADEVMKEGLAHDLVNIPVKKLVDGRASPEKVFLEDVGKEATTSGMMLYTSGTTNRPKGVLLPQDVLTAQSKSLLQAWEYTPEDHLLHVLPLHHIHGIVNAIITPLLAGSTIEFIFPFTVDRVWHRLAAPFLADTKATRPPVTFLTVVPTIYNRLLQSHKSLSPDMQAATKESLKPSTMRLNISGSAALPTPTKQAWADLSDGNILLERYGMTEVGMALSCGLSFQDRVDGSVGWPLPSVSVRLVDSDTNEIIEPGQEVDSRGRERQGEIQLKGPTIFREYWRNPTATASEFTADGFFKTGDIAVRRVVDGAGNGDSGDWARGPMYFIQGRKSADIIKFGGEKISALEVEREMLSLPEISECAVVGLASESWGQKVATVIVLGEEGKTGKKDGKPYGAMDLRRALKNKLANYKIPQELKVVESIPRNAMGKINKKLLVRDVFGEQ